jgi:transcriptional regulator with XRE-family HTH domain
MTRRALQRDAFQTERDELLHVFGRNFRVRRERLDISQETFAKRAGIHRTQLGAIERGKTEPRLSMLLILAEGLGTEPISLLQGLSAPRERRTQPRGASLRARASSVN